MFEYYSGHIYRETSETKSQGDIGRASLPPRGWNSYDSFCWTISEEEFLQNAELVAQRLKPHGYEVIVSQKNITIGFNVVFVMIGNDFLRFLVFGYKKMFSIKRGKFDFPHLWI